MMLYTYIYMRTSETSFGPWTVAFTVQSIEHAKRVDVRVCVYKHVGRLAIHVARL